MPDKNEPITLLVCSPDGKFSSLLKCSFSCALEMPGTSSMRVRSNARILIETSSLCRLLGVLGGTRGRYSAKRRTALIDSSAILGPFVACEDGVAEESEDPWPCAPGFRRVCLCRWGVPSCN